MLNSKLSNSRSIRLLAFLLHWILPLASCDSTTEWAAQFIYYNGTIEGSYAFDQENATSCGDNGAYYFGGLNNSYMRVGVHPPWDSNPFFFQLGHYGDNWNDNSSSRIAHNPKALEFRGPEGKAKGASKPSKRDFCISVGGCTDDSIYNLQFSTAWRVCQQDGHGCPWLTTGHWNYVAAEMVNLTTASVSNISSGAAISNNDNSAFYSVTGDEKTWVSNRTVDWNSFDFQVPGNYSEVSSSCGKIIEEHFNWNDVTHMTYSVNFTNTTNVSKFTIKGNSSTVTILFSGTRYDGDPDDSEVRSNDGTTISNSSLNTIALANPSLHSLPHFTFTNGTDFTFTGSYHDGWTVKSSALSKKGNLLSAPIWLAFTSSVMLVLFY